MPSVGDVYVVAKRILATNKKSYTIGSTVTLVKKVAPGAWLCVDEFGVSEWDTIVPDIRKGYLKLFVLGGYGENPFGHRVRKQG